MLAYSSIAHAGYLLAALWPGSAFGVSALTVLSPRATGSPRWPHSRILGALGRDGERDVTLADLAGLSQSRPWMAFALSVCMLSLLGFPGTIGFIGKWYILSATITARQSPTRGGAGRDQLDLGGLLSAGHHGDVHAVGPRAAGLLRPWAGRHRQGCGSGMHGAGAALRNLAQPGLALQRQRGLFARSIIGAGRYRPLTVPRFRTLADPSAAISADVHVPRSVFRQYDVRGLVGTELTPELARGLGRAVASMSWDRFGRAPDHRRWSGQPALRRLTRCRSACRDRGSGGPGDRCRPAARPRRSISPRTRSASRVACRLPGRTIRRSSTDSRWCSPARRCMARTSSCSTT